MGMTFPEQLSVSKIGVVKIGNTRPLPFELDHLTQTKVDTVTELQFQFWDLTIWLVGELIHVIRPDRTEFRYKWYEQDLLQNECRKSSEACELLG